MTILEQEVADMLGAVYANITQNPPSSDQLLKIAEQLVVQHHIESIHNLSEMGLGILVPVDGGSALIPIFGGTAVFIPNDIKSPATTVDLGGDVQLESWTAQFSKLDE